MPMQHRAERPRSKKSERDRPKSNELKNDDWRVAFCVVTTSCLALLALLAFIMMKTICYSRHPADICHIGGDAMRAPTAAFAFPFLRGMLSGIGMMIPVAAVAMLHVLKPHIRNHRGVAFWVVHLSLAGFVISCILVMCLYHTDHFIPIPQRAGGSVPAPAPGPDPSQLAHVVNFQVPPGLVRSRTLEEPPQ